MRGGVEALPWAARRARDASRRCRSKRGCDRFAYERNAVGRTLWNRSAELSRFVWPRALALPIDLQPDRDLHRGQPSFADIDAAELARSVEVHAGQHQVHVVVIGVAVDGCDPTQASGVHVRFQLANRGSSQVLQVEALGYVRRNEEARNCPPAIHQDPATRAEDLRLRALDGTSNESNELLPLPGTDDPLGSEELSATACLVAIRDVLDQACYIRFWSKGLGYGMEVAVLDVAHKAADRSPHLAARWRRVEFTLHKAALAHCSASLNCARRSSAAAAAAGASSCIRRWPSGRTEATISTACSAAVRAANAVSESG